MTQLSGVIKMSDPRTAEILKTVQPLFDKFIGEHGKFIENWTKENLPEGDMIVGISVLVGGIGASSGILCEALSKDTGLSIDTLHNIVLDKMYKAGGKN